MSKGNVAVISVVGLPDPRTERIIYTLLNNEYNVTFIGPYKDTAILNAEKITVLTFEPNKYAIAGVFPFYNMYKKQLIKILERLNPDILLAINITSATFLKGMNYPLVIDLREVLDLRYFYGTLYREGKISKFQHTWIVNKIIKDEKELFERSNLITISKTSFEHYRLWFETKKIEIAKNYPLLIESKEPLLSQARKELILTYIGKEILKHKYGPHSYHRDMSLTWKILREKILPQKKAKLIVIGTSCDRKFHIRCLGYIPHLKIYEHISNAHYGLLTMKPSPIHFYANLLRVYMFTFMGVIPIITSSFKDVIEDIKEYAITIDAFNFKNDLQSKLEYILEIDAETLMENKRKLLRYSRKNLIWEKNEKNILNAFKKV